MNEKELKKWTVTREKGKKRFVLIWTAYFIFLSFTAIPLVDYLLGKLKFPLSIGDIVMRILVFGLLGTITGFNLWIRNEKFYKEKQSEQ